MSRFLKFVSAIVWGAIGIFFGLGMVLAGLQNMPRPGGILAIILGAIVAAATYAAHRATCWLASKPRRVNKPV